MSNIAHIPYFISLYLCVDMFKFLRQKKSNDSSLSKLFQYIAPATLAGLIA